MSPLAGRCIATVGTGVMAESIVAGLIRGELVEPSAVMASHPRPDRREHLARELGIRVTASNVGSGHRRGRGAPRRQAADAPPRRPRDRPAPHPRPAGPQRDRRGHDDGPGGLLGHPEIVRSMPNTPAQLGRGMTVWYATPETTDDQRAQAKALLSALGSELEVDDEKLVAMATAVSGTGPTYVFLFMEALIDSAVHLGFPRHVAHDLVVETLEGSTFFAKQSGDHPARAPQHGHLARWDECGGPPRARIRAPADRALRGGLGRVSPDGGARRPARGRRQRSPGTPPPVTATRPDAPTSQASPAPAGSWRSSPTRTTRPSAPAGRWRLPLQLASRRGSSARRTVTRAVWRAPARSTRSFGGVSCAAR